MIVITLLNEGGELDRREVESPVDAPEAVRDLVMSAGELYPGDRIVISGDEEGEEA